MNSKAGTLDIGHPWFGALTPKKTPTSRAAISSSITSKGKVADRLTAARCCGSQIEVHEMANVDGMMKTRMLANGLEIKYPARPSN